MTQESDVRFTLRLLATARCSVVHKRSNASRRMTCGLLVQRSSLLSQSPTIGTLGTQRDLPSPALTGSLCRRRDAIGSCSYRYLQIAKITATTVAVVSIPKPTRRAMWSVRCMAMALAYPTRRQAMSTVVGIVAAAVPSEPIAIQRRKLPFAPRIRSVRASRLRRGAPSGPVSSPG